MQAVVDGGGLVGLGRCRYKYQVYVVNGRQGLQAKCQEVRSWDGGAPTVHSPGFCCSFTVWISREFLPLTQLQSHFWVVNGGTS